MDIFGSSIAGHFLAATLRQAHTVQSGNQTSQRGHCTADCTADAHPMMNSVRADLALTMQSNQPEPGGCRADDGGHKAHTHCEPESGSTFELHTEPAGQAE